ncbi:glycosyltransferase family 2 protein [Fusobacterium ulcerans]|uniref:glycosyltransferase family 2 protein n=1 Tax=Fusobacterium ulcerans TaxID=861 RepID=UPI001D09F29B|nr:glycosyltransferase [Fusobacterium ulcerans]MCB8565221.1 glycosyltransferase [Fusobacterium ulcerans]MCB8649295.1 glycosyltransferase [Fusobacterium ulcerans]
MEAIVLAGRFGIRLKKIVSDVSKPMVPVNEKLFLEYLIKDLGEKGIRHIILAVGYKKEIRKEYFKNRYENIEITYSKELTPLGIGEAIKKALKKALKSVKEADICIVNGDTFFNVDLKRMKEFHIENKNILIVAVKEMENFDRYSSLVIKENRIIEFEEKKKKDKGKINGGIYLIKKDLLNRIEKENFSFEKEVLEDKRIEKYSYESKEYFIDIGMPRDYYLFREKQKSPEISIIIPIYNREKYLEKCIRSVMEQDFKDIEIICVNDGSEDKSLEILESLQKEDERIIIVNKKNGGSSSARNVALKIARGKYCLNIDSDDWIEQGYFKAMYERAEKDNLDITISDIKVDYLNNDKTEYRKDLNISETEAISNLTYLKSFYTYNFLGYTCNKLIKRELYSKNNIVYNEKIFLLEDVEAIGKLIYFAEKIGKINKAFYHYRIGENNGSNNNIKLKHLTDVIECFKNLEKFYIENNELDIKNLISRKKNLVLTGMFLGGKFYKFFDYDKYLKEYLKNIKNDKFIFNRYDEVLKNEEWEKIILFNVIKIFPQKILIKFLNKIISNIKRKKR